MTRLITISLAVFYFFIATIAGAAYADSSKGKIFFLTFQKNLSSASDLSFFISSEKVAEGVVEIPKLNFTRPFEVTPEAPVKIEIPTDIARQISRQISGVKAQLGIKITANNDVSVYSLNQQQYTTDAFLALPINVLGSHYYTIGYHSSGSSQIKIVGIYDNTEVKINYEKFTDEIIILDSLDTYRVEKNKTPSGLTGTEIVSSAPVAVFSGNSCTTVPRGYGACDHIVEMMPPVSSWGKEFVTVPLATRLRGDVFRILASQDNTEVFINGELSDTLSNGEFFETILTQRSIIKASHPVLVVQYSAGQQFDGVISDPFMMLIPPVEQFLSNYTFTAIDEELGFTKNYVNVVALNEDIGSLILDNNPIDPSLFLPIGESGYSGAQIPIEDGVHTIEGLSSFGIYSYGFGTYESYGYPGGMNFDLINSAGDRFPPNIKLTTFEKSIKGIAGDFEDVNLNGFLESEEDLNKNGKIDRRSEDLNNNGELDADEDTNNDGILDRDSGIFAIRLKDGAINLALQTDDFVPGTLKVQFTLVPIDPELPASGILQVVDGVGNTVEETIVLSTTQRFSNVRLVSTLDTHGIALKADSFTQVPTTIESTADHTLIEWNFDEITIDQIQNLSYAVTLQNPIADETRLITQKLEIYYQDVNGNPVYQKLSEQSVDVLSSRYVAGVATNANAYRSGETVELISSLENISTLSGEVEYEITIVDSTDTLVDRITTEGIALIHANETARLSHTWETNTILSGSYKAKLIAIDRVSGDEVVDETIFNILPSSSTETDAALIALRSSTDKASYFVGQDIELQQLVENQFSNTIVSDALLLITVMDDQGENVFERTIALNELAPLNHQVHQQTLTTQGFDEGSLVVDAKVIDANQTTLASAQSLFHLTIDPRTYFAGSVNADFDERFRGEAQACQFTVTNNTAASTDIAFRRLLVDVESQDILSSEDATQTFDANTGQSLPQTIDTQALTLNTAYACVLQIKVGDQWITYANDIFQINERPIALQLASNVSPYVLVLLDGLSGDDINGPAASVNHAAQVEYLETLLKDNGIAYQIVDNAASFEQEVLAGAYTAYAMFSESHVLSEQVQENINAQVLTGKGLMLTHAALENNPLLDATLGIKTTDRAFIASRLVDGLTNASLTLPLVDALNTVETIDAQSMAFYELSTDSPDWFIDVNDRCERTDQMPAITQLNTSVYVGFDLLAFAATNETPQQANPYSQLLVASLQATFADQYALTTGEALQVALDLTSEGQNNVRVTAQLPQGFTIKDGSSFTQQADDVWQWVLTMPENTHMQQRIEIETATIADQYAVEFIVEKMADNAYVQQADAQLNVNIINPLDYLSDAITALDELKAQHPRDADLQFASWYLRQVNSDDVTKALATIKLSLASLKSSSVDTQAIQVLLAREVIKLNQQ